MEILYSVYCFLHKRAKVILGKYTDTNDYEIVNKSSLKYIGEKQITPPHLVPLYLQCNTPF